MHQALALHAAHSLVQASDETQSWKCSINPGKVPACRAIYLRLYGQLNSPAALTLSSYAGHTHSAY